MDEKINEEGFEAVCGPMIRIEAALHRVPGSPFPKGSNGAEFGASEACEWAPLIKLEAQLKPVAGTINRFRVAEYHQGCTTRFARECRGSRQTSGICATPSNRKSGDFRYELLAILQHLANHVVHPTTH